MRRLTERRQSVTVMTVSTLRGEFERMGGAACRFSLHNVHHDRVSVRAEYLDSGKKKRSSVVLPPYPTGSPDDGPSNNLNVVMDPVDFLNANSATERHVFEPLLGHEVLAHYEKLHAQSAAPVARCC